MDIQSVSTKKNDCPTAGVFEDSDSDDDDLLNFVAFPKKKESQSDTAPVSTATTVEESTCSPVKVTQDCDEDETECVEEVAEKRAEIAAIPDSIKNPSELYWHTRTKKGQKIHEPCRECHPDEALGLDIAQSWDPELKVLVQYIEFVALAERALVSRKTLTPYHGYKNTEERDEGKDKKEEGVPAPKPASWCTEKLKLLKRQRKKRGWDEIEPLTEELYLQRLLDHAVKMQEELRTIKDKEEKDAVISSQVSSCQRSAQLKKVETRDAISASSDEDDSEVKTKKSKSVLLRCGELIEYYNPIFVFGDERGLKTATILAVNPKTKNHVLKLSSDDVLPIETLVKQIKIMVRGNLIDNKEKGEFNGIEWYKLRKDEKNNANLALSIQKEAKRCRDIVVRAQERFKKKVQKIGLGDCTEMMTSFK